MPQNVGNFIISLAAAMGAAASPPMATGVDIFALNANETSSGDAYSVLRPYGGDAPDELRPTDTLLIQVMTSSKSGIAGGAGLALNLAWRAYQALRNDDGTPLHNFSVPGKVIQGDGTLGADPAFDWLIRFVDLQQPPGYVGRDADGRANVSFNFRCRFDAVPKS